MRHSANSALLVADDPGLRRVMAAILQACGLSVLRAETRLKTSLIQVGAQCVIAVVDLDSKTPEALGAIRALRHDPALSIIALLSSCTPHPRLLRVLDAGVDDLIQKPIDCDDFRQRVFAALRLRLRMKDEPERYAHRGMRIDVAMRSVRQHGEEVALSHAEYAFLETLVRSGGRVVRPVQLLKAIAPFSPRATERSLPGLAWRIRRKIKSCAGDPSCLLAERGVGYRLADETKTNG